MTPDAEPESTEPLLASREGGGLRVVLVGVCLAVSILAVYAPVREHQFLNYDDDEYVTANTAVRNGLSSDSVHWAFTSTHQATWHPLTSLSHMLDVELFGLRAGPHLRMNVILHVMATLMLLVVMREMTGALGPSAFVAGVFALHPLHVESVAWVSERKDVLSGLLWMVALWRYGRFARRPTRVRYLVLVLVFGMALLAKPMVVTLPFVLLLLDVWPLRRFGHGSRSGGGRTWGALVLEKLPLLLMAIAVGIVTFLVQRGAGAVAPLAAVPLGPRVANALVAYATYLRKAVWPVDLAPFYPFDPGLPLAQVVGAGVLLASVSVLVVAMHRGRPYLLVGWFWFIGTLVPVIGLIRHGEQAMADRFTYLPLVGVSIMVAWGLRDLFEHRRGVLAGLGVGALAVCALLTARQVAFWENSATLFRHTLAVTSGNHLAHTNLAVALTRAGAADEAMPHYAEALRLKPDYAKAQVNFGKALADRGQWEVAAVHYAEALRLDPGMAMAEYNWGLLLADQGELEAAIARYSRALALNPRYARAYNNRGSANAALRRYPEAIADYRAALEIAPDLAPAHNNLAVALEEIGDPEAAVAHYASAVRLAPDDPKARYNFAAALVGQDRAAESIAHYRVVVRLAPNLVEARYGLAVALGAVGREDDAMDAAEQAAALARSSGRLETAREIEAWMRRYPDAASSAAR